MHVPDPVVSMSLKTAKREEGDKLSKALNRFVREDPTFRTRWDDEAKEVVGLVLKLSMSLTFSVFLSVYDQFHRNPYMGKTSVVSK